MIVAITFLGEACTDKGGELYKYDTKTERRFVIAALV